MIDTTASYSAACSIAKLRVGWTVVGWAFGVPRIEMSSRFQSMTNRPDPGVSAMVVGAAAPEVARAGTTRPTATAAVARVTRVVVLLCMAAPSDGRVGAARRPPGRPVPAPIFQ